MPTSDPIATITPLESTECEVATCDELEFVARVEPDTGNESRTLCPRHRAEYLQEVYK